MAEDLTNKHHCAFTLFVLLLDPALLDPYVESETQGISNLTEMVLDYQSCCPDSKMVLLGYSQGAQVTADFLCGRSEAGFDATPAYASEVADSRKSFFFFCCRVINARGVEIRNRD